MRKILTIAALAALALTGCNTIKGTVNGVGRDLSAIGGAFSSGGSSVQTTVPVAGQVVVPTPQYTAPGVQYTAPQYTVPVPQYTAPAVQYSAPLGTQQQQY